MVFDFRFRSTTIATAKRTSTLIAPLKSMKCIPIRTHIFHAKWIITRFRILLLLLLLLWKRFSTIHSKSVIGHRRRNESDNKLIIFFSSWHKRLNTKEKFYWSRLMNAIDSNTTISHLLCGRQTWDILTCVPICLSLVRSSIIKLSWFGRTRVCFPKNRNAFGFDAEWTTIWIENGIKLNRERKTDKNPYELDSPNRREKCVIPSETILCVCISSIQ